METKLKNTIYEFEFCDGSKANLTLAFYKLIQLKSKHKSLYERYCKAQKQKELDELELITVLYAAYICANLDSAELMSEEEFAMMCGSDRIAVFTAYKELTQPKKQ